MLPDISEIPIWAKLMIAFASACTGYIIMMIFFRHKEAKRKMKIKVEKETEQTKQNVIVARQKFEKLLSDHPTYYLYPDKWAEIEKIKKQISGCKVTSGDVYYDLAKRYIEVYFNSFKPLAKYDIELKRLLNSYTDAVDELVSNKNVPKDTKQSAVSMIEPYLNALDILMPKSFGRHLPVQSSISVE